MLSQVPCFYISFSLVKLCDIIMLGTKYGKDMTWRYEGYFADKNRIHAITFQKRLFCQRAPFITADITYITNHNCAEHTSASICNIICKLFDSCRWMFAWQNRSLRHLNKKDNIALLLYICEIWTFLPWENRIVALVFRELNEHTEIWWGNLVDDEKTEVKGGGGGNNGKWVLGIQFVKSGVYFSWLRVSYSDGLWCQGYWAIKFCCMVVSCLVH
jgi:hypothetical protein